MHPALRVALLALLLAPAPTPAGEGFASDAPRESRWYLGFGVGTVSLTSLQATARVPGIEPAYAQVTDPGLTSLHLRAGVALSSCLLLGVELTGATSFTKGEPRFADAGAVLTWFPLGAGSFLRAGVGAADKGRNLGGQRSIALSRRLGGGHAFRLGSAFHLTGSLDYLSLLGASVRAAGSGNELQDGFEAWVLSVGFDWH